eukprot:gene626-617_t
MISLIALLTFSPSSPHGILSTLIPTISDMATAGETSGNVGRPDVEDSDVDIKGLPTSVETDGTLSIPNARHDLDVDSKGTPPTDSNSRLPLHDIVDPKGTLATGGSMLHTNRRVGADPGVDSDGKAAVSNSASSGRGSIPEGNLEHHVKRHEKGENTANANASNASQRGGTSGDSHDGGSVRRNNSSILPEPLLDVLLARWKQSGGAAADELSDESSGDAAATCKDLEVTSFDGDQIKQECPASCNACEDWSETSSSRSRHISRRSSRRTAVEKDAASKEERVIPSSNRRKRTEDVCVDRDQLDFGVTVSGACAIKEDLVNGNYTYQGMTLDGRAYYMNENDIYIYYDKDCNGGEDGDDWWIIDNSRPSTNAAADLDLDGDCWFYAYIDSSSQTIPTEETVWQMFCENGWTEVTLKIASQDGIGEIDSLACKDRAREGHCPRSTVVETQCPESCNATAVCKNNNLKSQVADWLQNEEAARQKYGDIKGWDVSSVTDMSLLFKNEQSFNADLSSWDVSNVNGMSEMFYNADAFNSDLSAWDVANVNDMSYMFFYADTFNSDLSAWDVSNVNNMSKMFYDAYAFNSDLNGWDVSSVNDMSKMFNDVDAFNSDLSSWDVSNVNDMSKMFFNADAFNSDLSAWDVSNVNDMSEMFSPYETSAFNSDLSAWDVSNVNDMSGMFLNAAAFNSDLSAWDVSNVNDMSDMFYEADAFNSDLSAWDVSSVNDMSEMFYDADAFNSDLSAWDVSNVTSMAKMFNYAYAFNSDLSAWDVSNVNDMAGMFYDADAFNSNLTGWDVSNVKKMGNMFKGTASFNQDLGSWYFSPGQAIVFADMFTNAKKTGCTIEAPANNFVNEGDNRKTNAYRIYCNPTKKKDGATCSSSNSTDTNSSNAGAADSECDSGVCGTTRCCSYRSIQVQETRNGGDSNDGNSKACSTCTNTGDCFNPPTLTPKFQLELFTIENEDGERQETEKRFPTQLIAGETRKIQWKRSSNDKILSTADATFKLRWINSAAAGLSGSPGRGSRSQDDDDDIYDDDDYAIDRYPDLQVGQQPPSEDGESSPIWDPEGLSAGPGGVEIIEKSGTIYATPTEPGTYTAWLIAEDPDGRQSLEGMPELDQVLIKKWTVTVTKPVPFLIDPTFVSRDVTARENVNSTLFTKKESGALFIVGETYRFAPIKIDDQGIQGAKSGNITYTLVTPPPGFLIDPTDGYIQGIPTTSQHYNMSIYAIDGAGTRSKDPIEYIYFDVRTGPDGKRCENGVAVAALEITATACDCGDDFEGVHCETSTAAAKTEKRNTVIFSTLGTIVALLIAATSAYMYRARKLRLRAHDFQSQLEEMRANGELPDNLLLEAEDVEETANPLAAAIAMPGAGTSSATDATAFAHYLTALQEHGNAGNQNTALASHYLASLETANHGAAAEPIPTTDVEPTYAEAVYKRIMVSAAEIEPAVSPLDGLESTPLTSLRNAVAHAMQHALCNRPSMAPALEASLAFAENLVARGKSVGLSVDQAAALHFYSQELPVACPFYSALNGALGGWGRDGHTPARFYLPYVKLATSALRLLPAEPKVLYRGIKGISLSQLLGNRKVGDMLTWLTFTSTTGEPDVLRDPTFFGIGAEFGERTVFKINTTSGVSIKRFSDFGMDFEYYMQPVDKHGQTHGQNEDEYLFAPGSTFIIVAIETFTTGVTEVELTEVESALTAVTPTENAGYDGGGDSNDYVRGASEGNGYIGVNGGSDHNTIIVDGSDQDTIVVGDSSSSSSPTRTNEKGSGGGGIRRNRRDKSVYLGFGSEEADDDGTT